MVMITEEEFVAQMLEKGLEQYKNKRQLAFAIGLENAQSLNHWIKRNKVPGDWKPKVAELLGIHDWFSTTSKEVTNNLHSGSSVEPPSGLSFDGVDFVLRSIEMVKTDPEFDRINTDPEYKARAFIALYRMYHDEDMKEMGVKPVLRLVA